MQANKLVISQNQLKSLSKSQEKFNKLIKEIEKLKAKKVELAAQIDEVKIMISKKIIPVVMESKDSTLLLVTKLDEAYDTVKLAKGERETLSRFIVQTLSTIMETMKEMGEDMEAYEAIYIKHNDGVSLEEEEGDMNDMAADLFKNMFGIDIDPDKMDDPEYIKSKESEFENFGFGGGGPRKERKKTKKQLEAEAKQKAAEDKMKKDTKTIYTQLVKQLHPDSEQDEKMRDIKTELMKRVTTAYSDNDLYELLQIQIEVEQLDADALSSASDEVMESYIQVLQKQVREMQDQINGELRQNPIYNEYFNYQNDKFVESRLRKKVKELKDSAKELTQILNIVNNAPALKSMLKDLKKEFKMMDEMSGFNFFGF